MGRQEVSDHGKAGGRVPHRAVPGLRGHRKVSPTTLEDGSGGGRLRPNEQAGVETRGEGQGENVTGQDSAGDNDESSLDRGTAYHWVWPPQRACRG